MNRFDLVVIGGGAAGFYGAIQAATLKPDLRILILEKTSKVLSKVRVSGGGRCNVTHHCFQPIALSHHYPRGEKHLQPIFKNYHAAHVVDWFASKGVTLEPEEDGRIFPVTNTSETIINCFVSEVERLKIKVNTSEGVEKISGSENNFQIDTANSVYHSSKILIAIGGSPKREAYNVIAGLGHTIKSPIPSLFTFNDNQRDFQDLMGISVTNAEVKIVGTKFIQHGPLLITHWGLSGPAVIKLSAWAAEFLHEKNYSFSVLVSWVGHSKEETLREQLLSYREAHGKQRVVGNALFKIPVRLWERLCERADIDQLKIWSELPLKNLNKLLENLMRCPFTIKGKTTFKDEFVTCGGADLSEIDLQTMESKKISGIYFAGEALNIDGETGGFNFQAAWSTAYLAAKAITARRN
jgi:predicted Rossmann fold flavoprotein